MTPSDKLRELAELSEKATQGEWENARGFVRSRLPTTGMLGSVAETTEGEGYVPDNGNAAFIAALVNWYRTEGRQLAEDGLRYRWLRESGHTFANEHERNRYCKAFDAGIDEAITKDTHAQEES